MKPHCASAVRSDVPMLLYLLVSSSALQRQRLLEIALTAGQKCEASCVLAAASSSWIYSVHCQPLCTQSVLLLLTMQLEL